MPRTARAVCAGIIYHVINRGNGRMNLFHKDADFLAFEKILAQGIDRYPVDLLSYCLMNNHWHLVLRPRADDALGRLMGWICVTHVRRHHEHYGTRGGGHLYQGRFKSFPVQEDRHFLLVCRYVEANAVRAGLTNRAIDWRWGAASARRRRPSQLALTNWPVDRPGNWTSLLDDPLNPAELDRMRTSVIRGRPYGTVDWVAKTAKRLHLEFTFRNAGRPRKENNQ